MVVADLGNWYTLKRATKLEIAILLNKKVISDVVPFLFKVPLPDYIDPVVIGIIARATMHKDAFNIIVEVCGTLCPPIPRSVFLQQ